jgi:PKD repeat protein
MPAKMKYFYSFFLGFFFFSALTAQNILFTENFENQTNAFVLNSTDQGGVNFGENIWIVNSIYQGGSLTPTCVGVPLSPVTIPNTPAQPGAVPSANGRYLHILSVDGQSGSNNILNSNYKAADGFCFSTESHFARMNVNVNSVGETNTRLRFWWLNQGSPDAFGQVYYSTNGGSTWTVVPGFTAMHSQGQWIQATIQLPIFDNQTQLRFGFRFVNNNTSNQASSSPAFSIDNVVVEADGPPVLIPDITMGSLGNPVLCTNQTDSISFTVVNGPLDPNNIFTLQLSNAAGSFANPFLLGNQPGATSGQFVFTIPPGTAPGTNYQLRVVSSNPAIIGGASPPFSIFGPVTASVVGNLAGGSLTLDGTGSDGGSSHIWNPGDGTPPTTTPSNVFTFNHTYTSNGQYTACLTVTNACDTDSSCFTSLVCIPGGGGAPLSVNFNANLNSTTINFTDNSVSADSLYLDFGNGVGQNITQGAVINYTYPNQGTYTVCLYGTNFCDQSSDSTCQTFVVCTNAAGSLNVAFIESLIGNTILINDVTTGADSLYVDFGDGNGQPAIPGSSINHTYLTPGVYNVCVRGFNFCDGTNNQVCKSVTVTATGIDETQFGTITLYPNPVSQEFKLNLPPNLSLDKATMHDLSGRLIKVYSSEQLNNTIPVQTLSPGSYIFTWYAGALSGKIRVVKALD